MLLIVLDSARADALEPYGASPGASPVLADLAKRGSALPHAYASASWTLPSHASMFSGRLPRGTGLMQAPQSTPLSCRPFLEALGDQLLPEVLRRSGYETRAISANLWLTPESGFATGFDRFETVDSGRLKLMDRTDTRARARWAIEAARATADDGAAEVLETVRKWSREPADQPFFWFVNLVECHSPYLPPSPYNPLGLIGRMRAADEARRYLTLPSIWRACAGALDVPDAALGRMRRLYGGAIRQLDAWVGDALEAVDDAGRLDDTLVIVTADHGENFGEQGLMAHAFSLDERLIRVPFITAGPGKPNRDGAFSLVELPRVVAAAAGVDPHPGWEATEEGVAVAQFDPPGSIDHPRWVERLAEWGHSAEIAGPRVAAMLTAATDGRHKLVRRDDDETAFDLVSDPDERKRLAPADLDSEVVARLRRGLEREGAAARPVAADTQPEASEEELRDLEERMKLLGYL